MNKIKALVSKKKRRFQRDGFDLDLTYITDRLIAMGFPSEGVEGIYRNDMESVRTFLTKYHDRHYKVYNLCSERAYAPKFFRNSYSAYPFDDHGPCSFEVLLDFCEDAYKYLSRDKQNVIIAHCKAGKGRTGTVISALLLYDRSWSTADEALDYFAGARSKNKSGVTIPSQWRYVQYMEKYLKCYKYVERPFNFIGKPMRLVGFCLMNLGRECVPWFVITSFGDYELYNYRKENKGTQTWAKDSQFHLMRCDVAIEGDTHVLFYIGDMKKKKKKKLCGFWIHTSFVHSTKILFGKNDLDIANKDKRCPKNFQVEAFFAPLPNTRNTFTSMCSSADPTHPGYDGAELVEFEKEGEKLNYGHQRFSKSSANTSPVSQCYDLTELYSSSKDKSKKKDKDKDKEKDKDKNKEKDKDKNKEKEKDKNKEKEKEKDKDDPFLTSASAMNLGGSTRSSPVQIPTSQTMDSKIGSQGRSPPVPAATRAAIVAAQQTTPQPQPRDSKSPVLPQKTVTPVVTPPVALEKLKDNKESKENQEKEKDFAPQLDDFYAYVRRATEAPTKPVGKFDKQNVCAQSGCDKERIAGAYCDIHRPTAGINFSTMEVEQMEDPLDSGTSSNSSSSAPPKRSPPPARPFGGVLNAFHKGKSPPGSAPTPTAKNGGPGPGGKNGAPLPSPSVRVGSERNIGGKPQAPSSPTKTAPRAPGKPPFLQTKSESSVGPVSPRGGETDDAKKKGPGPAPPMPKKAPPPAPGRSAPGPPPGAEEEEEEEPWENDESSEPPPPPPPPVDTGGHDEDDDDDDKDSSDPEEDMSDDDD